MQFIQHDVDLVMKVAKEWLLLFWDKFKIRKMLIESASLDAHGSRKHFSSKCFNLLTLQAMIFDK